MNVLTITFTNHSKQTLTYAEDTFDTGKTSGTIANPPAVGSIVLKPGDTETLVLNFSNATGRTGIDFGPKFTYLDANGNPNSVSAEVEMSPLGNFISCTPAAGDTSAVTMVKDEVLTQDCSIDQASLHAPATVTWFESLAWGNGPQQ